jgi:hypothetical protein
VAGKTGEARPPAVKSVDEFLRGLEHPLAPALVLVCATIRGASPQIAEGIKWNSPSFYLKKSEAYFATVNVNTRTKGRDCVSVIFHQGAKVKSAPGPKIEDSDGILEWLGKDRAAAWFFDLKEVKAKKTALAGVGQQWIAQI